MIDLENPKAKFPPFLVLIIVGILIMLITTCASGVNRHGENDAWDAQMQKDPSTWTKTEQRRYNNFMNWLDENDQN